VGACISKKKSRRFLVQAAGATLRREAHCSHRSHWVTNWHGSSRDGLQKGMSLVEGIGTQKARALPSTLFRAGGMTWDWKECVKLADERREKIGGRVALVYGAGKRLGAPWRAFGV